VGSARRKELERAKALLSKRVQREQALKKRKSAA